jgi:hypothetical protein
MRRRPRGTPGLRRSARVSTLDGLPSRYTSQALSPDEVDPEVEAAQVGEWEHLNLEQPEVENISQDSGRVTFRFSNLTPVGFNLDSQVAEGSSLKEFTTEGLGEDTGDQQGVPNFTGSPVFPGQTGSGTNTMARQGARLKYNKFRCDGSQDADEWIKEFDVTIEANQEDPDTRSRIFPGLLRGEALLWYDDVPAATRHDWAQLSALFKTTFQDLGGDHGITNRLNELVQREGEPIRSFGHRMKSLMAKLSYAAPAPMQIEWYVSGIDPEVARYVRRHQPATLREAMELAVACVESDQAAENSKKKKQKNSKAIRRARDKARALESGSESGSDGQQSSDSSPPPRRSSNTRSHRKDEDSSRVRVKVETPDTSKQIMKDLTKAVAELTVRLAAPQKTRRTIPTFRKNVWCSNCGNSGHNSSECPHSKPVHYVDTDGTKYYPAEIEEEESEEAEVYNVTPAYGRGKGLFPVFQTGQQSTGNFQGMPSQPRPMQQQVQRPFVKQYAICFFCGDEGHFARDCPVRAQYRNNQNQGAPIELPCQNCGEHGHPSSQCTKPQKPKVIYRKVETLPRDQTALNYGNLAGVDRPAN